MMVLGYILFYVGCVVGIGGEVMFLATARKHGWVWFWGCLFLPAVGLIFFLLNVKATWKPFVASLVGLVVAAAGSQLAGIVWPD